MSYWRGELVKVLARVKALEGMLDGTEPVTGDVDLGGHDILNVGNLVASTKITVFTASGTFTPDPDMLECEVIAYGGGGAGGGSPATAAGTVSAGTGGNGGAKAVRRLTAVQIGASQTVTIGAGGTGVSGSNGNSGGNTTLGTLLSAKGGEGGNVAAASTAVGPQALAATQSATGDIRGWTHLATMAGYGTTSQFAVLSRSGANELGGSIASTLNANGTAANANTGAGGGATLNLTSQAARTGGAGGSGLMIIREFLHS